jgi:HD-GYP domain-containing protein (c-di-GMP phosphodiesterase class II)
MNKIPVSALQEGLRFSDTVYIDGDNILVPKGIPIRQKDIDQLKSWGVEVVETLGDILDPDADDAGAGGAAPGARPVTAGNPGAASPAAGAASKGQDAQTAHRDYLDLVERFDGVLEAIAAGAPSAARAVDSITVRLFQTIRRERERIIGYILGGEVQGRDQAKSAVNTAVLAALIAEELKLPDPRITAVVSGALLHDAGMLRLPQGILTKRGVLSKAELEQIQTHPLHSYQIVCKELQYPEAVGLVALQHHERWDGTGYPRQLAGAAIDIGARIVSVADAFEAMVSEKPYRNSMVGYRAMKNLLSDNSRRFDPNVLRAFIKTLGIYPIGSIVLLNNGAVARVTDVRGDAPLRPQICLLIDEAGTVLGEEQPINLLQEKSLFITRAMDAKELAKKRE